MTVGPQADVRLYLADQAAAVVHKRPAPAKMSNGLAAEDGGLVADDYAGLADTMASILMKLLPCEAVAPLDGAAALELALVHRPAACVLDVDMPRMGGIEAALAIRSGLRDSPPLLIATTGGAAAQAKQSGAFHAVLQKPVDVQRLLDLLEPLSRR